LQGRADWGLQVLDALYGVGRRFKRGHPHLSPGS
jgi:hypothetical protein